MIVFVFLMFVICILYLLIKKESKGLFLAITSVLLFIIYALKNPLLYPDLSEYLIRFSNIGDISSFVKNIEIDVSNQEPGFLLLMSIIASITHNEFVFLIIIGLILILFYTYVIYKCSPSYLFSILLFIITNYQSSFYLLRQSLAMVICYSLIPYIYKKNVLKFIAGILIACSFHRVALVFLPIYFIYGYKYTISKQFIILTTFLIIILSICSNAIYYFFADYARSSFDSDYAVTTSTSSFIILFILSIYFYFGRRQINESNEHRLMFLCLIAALTIFTAGIGLPLVTRVGAYYSGLIFLIIPYIIKTISNKISRVFMTIIFFSLYYALFALSENNYAFLLDF